MAFLSGIKDLNLKILDELTDQELFSFCLVNKEANKLCDNESFWRNRFIKRFGYFSQIEPNKINYFSLIKELGKEIVEEKLKWNKDIFNFISSLHELNDGRVYHIHDNGGRPFKVFVAHNFVLVYKIIYNDIGEDAYFEFPNFVFLNPEKVFIGISLLNNFTKFGGGYGKSFDGNTILVNTDNNNYVYIGSQIFGFASKAKIVNYFSDVGNNDVPYPYAIDSEKNVYLMEENVSFSNLKDNPDPYDYYYSNTKEFAPMKIFVLHKRIW